MPKQLLLKRAIIKADLFIKAVTIFSLVSAIFILSHRQIADLDIQLHLKAGEVIADTKSVPLYDIFSFTAAGKPWIDHEWLFQLLAYKVYALWHTDGLIFLQSLIITLAFFVLFMIGYKSLGHYFEAAGLTAFAFYASTTRINIRPDMLSLLFFVLFLYILKFHKSTRAVWLLVPLHILWVNIHGYFFLGPFLVFLYIVADFLRRRFKIFKRLERQDPLLAQDSYLRLKRVLLVMITATLLNPSGLQGLLYPLAVLKDTLLQINRPFFEHIVELRPIFGPQSMPEILTYLYAILAICAVFVFLNFRRLKIIELLLAACFFVFSLRIRNVAFLAFICYIIIADYFAHTMNRISDNIEFKVPLKKDIYYLIRFALAVLFVLFLWSEVNLRMQGRYYNFDSGQVESRLAGIDTEAYPVAAADFVIKNDVKVNMFNDFNSGSYLVNRFYPKRKVFIDGRGELYGPVFFDNYSKMINGDKALFDKAADEYNIGACFFNTINNSATDTMAAFYKDSKWKLVFFDHKAMIFLKDIPANKEIIRKYVIDFNKYVPPAADLQSIGLMAVYPHPYVHRAKTLLLFGEYRAAMLEAGEALKIMPNCAEAYYILGKCYLQQELYPQAFESLRYAVIYNEQDKKALVDLSIALRNMRKYIYAEKVVKRALGIDKNYAAGYRELGYIYMAEGRLKQAIQAFGKAIKYSPRNPKYYYELGAAFMKEAANDRAYLTKAKEQFTIAAGLNTNDEELKRQIQQKLKELR